jgi:hypothetical protein
MIHSGVLVLLWYVVHSRFVALLTLMIHSGASVLSCYMVHLTDVVLLCISIHFAHGGSLVDLDSLGGAGSLYFLG